MGNIPQLPLWSPSSSSPLRWISCSNLSKACNSWYNSCSHRKLIFQFRNKPPHKKIYTLNKKQMHGALGRSKGKIIGEWLDFDATILCSLKLGNMSSQSRFAKALSKFLLWHHIFPCFSPQWTCILPWGGHEDHCL